MTYFRRTMQELGYTYVEMNASCTRSKNNLKEVIAESLNNTSIKSFYTGTPREIRWSGLKTQTPGARRSSF